MTFIVRFAESASSLPQVGLLIGDSIAPVRDTAHMASLLRRPVAEIRRLIESAADDRPRMLNAADAVLLPPIDGQTVVWAAGVTYCASRDARIDEARDEDVYDRVYWAERPELFFKSSAADVVTDKDPIGRRTDSTNDTPEPELAVVFNSEGEVVAFGVCNDMSSRSIEGENPLYLPQAKVYAGSCAMAPTLRPAWELSAPLDLEISLTITRDSKTVFCGTASTSRLKRTMHELGDWLFKNQLFPDGVVLSTGTCVVPPLNQPAVDGDVVTICINGVGSLTNIVTPCDEMTDWLTHRRKRQSGAH